MRFWQTKKFAFCLAALMVAIFLTVNFLNINDYGETWDESVHWRSGEINLDVFSGKAEINEIESNHNLKYYGPLADVLGQGSKIIFTDQLHWLNEVAAHHVHLIIFGAILLVSVFGLGYLTSGTLTAFLASVFLLLYPRFIGESQGNPKDLPVAALFALAIMFFVWAWQTKRWWQFILAGIILGLALAVRANALWVPLILFIWVIVSYRDRIIAWFKVKDKKSQFGLQIKKWGWSLLAYPFVAFGSMLAFWPWLWPAPISRFWEAVTSVGAYEWIGLVKYQGILYKAPELPWHYAPIIFFWVTPILISVLGFIGLVLVIKQTKTLSNRAGSLYPIWLAVVFGSIILLGIGVYDGIRHFFLVAPALVLLAGIGGSGLFHWLGRKFPASPQKRRLAAVILSVIIASAGGAIFFKMMFIHPYQLYYFNELAGGMGGAAPYYEVGYWGIEMKEGAAWLNANAPTGARVAILPTDKMALPYLRPDLAVVKEKEDPDYCLYLTKANFEPFKEIEPVYILTVDGAPLLGIKQIKSANNE